MSAQIIDGKAFAEKVRAQVGEHVARLKAEHGITPVWPWCWLAKTRQAGAYVRNKGKQTLEVGMNSYEHKLPADTPQDELMALIDRLNNDPAVHGILVQLPLPARMDSDAVINAIDPAKDSDGFQISNVGLLGTGQSRQPVSPPGRLMTLRDHLGNLSGRTRGRWAQQYRRQSRWRCCWATAAPSPSRTVRPRISRMSAAAPTFWWPPSAAPK
ncbi:tetrahydrofolate dehydrogenase/cyclohydrolase catalytic domain-containing protein [Paracoccus sp. DMF-8]|uniref:tetrahydrofolate dehydrogenase/cyclohydrolase catalytic domain-containing protein n=1 Tax=Paracoccus sp. DMF-8 TaxID=3019445 RepID=UPI0023E3ED91|nr:tetrahydrofolate dehydrogenase/cyclohydrolase catalytic domain-containing protein [Paracoccus sp. DMF-8]MDF3607932.1 tetrahydrofolate dehydrogenase/cyclohydrolase catalytic domain-containing protein [Paracoccus sp. DMF-8]